MKQRVAIVRALAWNPSILLMDEPFSALDELTKSQLQDDLLTIWNARPQDRAVRDPQYLEAIYLADRVVVMAPRPGTHQGHPVVDLPRPRLEAMRESPSSCAGRRAARAP